MNLRLWHTLGAVLAELDMVPTLTLPPIEGQVLVWRFRWSGIKQTAQCCSPR
jgi:hypothetical protein